MARLRVAVSGLSKRLVAAAYVAAAVLSIHAFFHDALTGYTAVLHVEYYYYILVLAAVIVAVGVHVSHRTPPRPDVFSLLLSAQLGAAALIMLLVGRRIGPEQLVYAGLITWLWAWAAGFLGVELMRRNIYTVAASYLAVPPSQRLLHGIGMYMARASAEAAAYLTGARVAEIGGLTYLRITGPGGGAVSYVVTHGCSGILSVLSGIPFIVAAYYIILYSSRRSPLDKAAGLAALGASLPALLFAGNTLRIAIVLSATRFLGKEYALSLFHSAPSLVSASLVQVILIIMIARHYGAPAADDGRGLWRINMRGASFMGAAALLLIALAAYQPVSAHSRPRGVLLDPLEPGLFVERLVSRAGLVEGVFERRGWGGSPIVYEALAAAGRGFLRVIVEVSPSKLLFHEWPVCLVSQGYRVVSSRTYSVGNSIVVHEVLYRGRGVEGVLYYFHIRLRGVDGSSYYVKVSVIGGGGADSGEAARRMAAWLGAQAGGNDEGGGVGGAGALSLAILAATAAYLPLIYWRGRFPRAGAGDCGR